MLYTGFLGKSLSEELFIGDIFKRAVCKIGYLSVSENLFFFFFLILLWKTGKGYSDKGISNTNTILFFMSLLAIKEKAVTPQPFLSGIKHCLQYSNYFMFVCRNV